MNDLASLTPEQRDLWEIREAVARLSDEERFMVQTIAQQFRNVLANNQYAHVAFALVGAEENAK